MKKMLIVTAMVALLAALVPATDAVAQETVQVKQGCGKIVKVVGNTVVALIDGTNQYRVFKNISPDIHFMVNGKEASVYDLREGMHACAYRIETVAEPAVIFIEETELPDVADEPDMHDAPPAPAPAPAAKPAPAPKPAPMPAALPHTASSLPLAGLAGLALLVLSAGVAVLRRF